MISKKANDIAHELRKIALFIDAPNEGTDWNMLIASLDVVSDKLACALCSIREVRSDLKQGQES